MENATEKSKAQGEDGLLNKIKKGVTNSSRPTDKRGFWRDIFFFAIGFVLSRCHLFFGARPVGLAFLAMLPIGIWPTAAGVVISGITLGIDGIIFAVAGAIIVLLRAAVSSGDRDELGRRLLFRESLLIRIAISILGGFVTAVYEVLMRGLNELTLLFGLVMILLTPLLSFGLSGLFNSGVRLEKLLTDSAVLSLSGIDKKERYDRVYFQFSSLLLIFLIGLSFKGVNIIGISASYIFSCSVTLLCAKRFGSLRAAAVGFVASLSLSAVMAVSAALMGLGAGALFSLGTGYATVIGGAILCGSAIYADGMVGLLSTLPEYAIAAAIAAPISKKLYRREETPTEKSSEISEEMLGIMALSYQAKYSGCRDRLAEAISDMGEVISRHTHSSAKLTLEEYRRIIISVAENYCIGCLGGSLCAKEGIRPAIKRADRLARLLSCGEKIMPDDVNSETEFCQMASDIAEEINERVAKEERERFLLSERAGFGEEYSLIAQFIQRTVSQDAQEVRVDDSLNQSLEKLLSENGIEGGSIRAFGKRRPHIILAGEDESGTKITSQKLREDIEKVTKLRLGAPEYYKRDKMLLMECSSERQFSVSYATACRQGKENEVSGDTALCFENGNDYFYSVISDGMGSGEVARESSHMASEFIKSASESGRADESVVHMLNQALRGQREECSATLDLFEVDLLSGKGRFIKSGAAPSYIKRGSSIYRIRSQTAPLGLLRTVDSEKTELEIQSGDYIFMFSDGICDSVEDAPWLLLLLGEEPIKDTREYADKLLREAIKSSISGDDMTVTVMRIDKRETKSPARHILTASKEDEKR